MPLDARHPLLPLRRVQHLLGARRPHRITLPASVRITGCVSITIDGWLHSAVSICRCVAMGCLSARQWIPASARLCLASSNSGRLQQRPVVFLSQWLTVSRRLTGQPPVVTLVVTWRTAGGCS